MVNGYFDNWYVTAFLEAMMHDLDGRFVVVWDGGPMHKGDPIRRLTDHFADRLCLEALPPWAPMLNPTEPLWGWLKYDRLCNYAPHDAAELDGRVVAELAAVKDDQQFLRRLVPCFGTPATADITFLTCCKYLKQLSPLFEELHDVGCQRDRAGNRSLFYDQYCLIVLLYLFNPPVPRWQSW